jgi:hypothetical protein
VQEEGRQARRRRTPGFAEKYQRFQNLEQMRDLENQPRSTAQRGSLSRIPSKLFQVEIGSRREVIPATVESSRRIEEGFLEHPF